MRKGTFLKKQTHYLSRAQTPKPTFCLGENKKPEVQNTNNDNCINREKVNSNKIKFCLAIKPPSEDTKFKSQETLSSN